jgi:hypothetical protein
MELLPLIDIPLSANARLSCCDWPPHWCAYSSDRERCFHAIVNGAWSWLLDCLFLRQVFTIRQGF